MTDFKIKRPGRFWRLKVFFLIAWGSLVQIFLRQECIGCNAILTGEDYIYYGVYCGYCESKMMAELREGRSCSICD